MKNQGFTLIEVLIALTLFGIMVSGIASMNTWLSSSVASESAKVDRDIENTEMLKLVTQPIYFGALKDFPDNLALKQCISVDNITCDPTKDYPLVPFDLTTKTRLKLVSVDELKTNIKNELTFKVHCPLNASSCDRASYFTVSVKTSLTYLNFAAAVVEKKGVVTPEFTNIVTFIPDSTVSPGRPMNVILFIDNSNSMLFAKDQIKTALDNLLIKLANMNVTVGIYTLRDIAVLNMNKFFTDGSGNRSTAFPSPIPTGFVYYWEYLSLPWWANYNMNFDPTKYTGMDPWGMNKVFPMLTTDTAALRADKLQSMRNLVDTYFQYPNIRNDLPLCNIIKMLDTPGSLPPIKFDPFTPSVFMVVTNEDDQTDFSVSYDMADSCKKGFLNKLIQNDDKYIYYSNLQELWFNITANVTNDGAPGTHTFSWAVPPRPYNSNYSLNSDCSADIPFASNSEIETVIKYYLKYFATNVQYTDGAGYKVNKCSVFNNRVNHGSNFTAPQTICSDIKNGLIQVPQNYIPNSCIEVKYPSWSEAIDQVYEITPGITDPVDATYEMIKKHIGAANVMFLPIVHTNGTTCTITYGSSVGTRYMSLATKLGANAKPIPICSPDYSAELSKMDAWIAAVAKNDLELSTYVAQNMNAVEIYRNGTTILLTANVDYSLVGTTLTFKAGILAPNDIIRVYLK